MGTKGVAGFKEGCRLGLNPLLMRVGNQAGKGTSGMDRFGSVIDRIIDEHEAWKQVS